MHDPRRSIPDFAALNPGYLLHFGNRLFKRLVHGSIIAIVEAKPRPSTDALHSRPGAGTDGGYVASVPVLPGCVSQGDTRAAALTNIREAIRLFIDDCRAANDPVPIEAGKAFVDAG